MSFFSSDNIQITLPKYIFAPGETISGKVVFNFPETKKVNSLSVSFFGKKEQRHRNRSINNRTSTHQESIEFARQNIILGGEGEYVSQEFGFSITIPTDIYPNKRNLLNTETLPSWAKIGVDILSSAVGMLEPNYTFWIEARIDIPWAIDDTRKIEITISRPAIQEGNI